jgi:hypothetical protein
LKLVSTAPGRPPTVTVSGVLAVLLPAVPLARAPVGSECGASAAALSVMRALVAPSAISTDEAVAPAGRFCSATCTAPVKPLRRVTVALICTVRPWMTSALSVDSAIVKSPLSAGGGLPPGGGLPAGASDPPPPQAASVVARTSSAAARAIGVVFIWVLPERC